MSPRFSYKHPLRTGLGSSRPIRRQVLLAGGASRADTVQGAQDPPNCGGVRRVVVCCLLL